MDLIVQFDTGTVGAPKRIRKTVGENAKASETAIDLLIEDNFEYEFEDREDEEDGDEEHRL